MKKNYADMDPTEEMRAIKEELSREFPTAKAFGEYVRSQYPMNPPSKPSRSSGRTPPKAAPRSVARRRKSAVHA